MSREQLLAALDRDTFDDVEWAQVTAGRCVRMTQYGMFPTASYCDEPAPAYNVFCVGHQDDFFADTGRWPAPDGS